MATVITNTQPYVMSPTALPGPVIRVGEEPHPATKHKAAFKYLGIAHIMVGTISVLLGGLAYIPQVTVDYPYVGSGIWAGVLYFVLGIVGLSTGSKPNGCNIVLGLVFGIIVSLVAFSVGIIESLISSNIFVTQLCRYNLFPYHPSCLNSAFTAIHSTLAALSFVELIVAIIHASFCCCPGCRSNEYQGQVLTTHTITHVPPSHVPIHVFAHPPNVQQLLPVQGIATQQTHAVMQQPQYVNYNGQQHVQAEQIDPPPAYQAVEEHPC